MWSWSRRSARRWLADRRGQTEPIAAIVAVLAIGVGLALYAGVAAERRPETEETDAEATMQLVTAALLTDGVYEADGSVRTSRYARGGETVRITVAWRDERVTYGPSAPPDADVARRPVAVSTSTGVQYSGVLTVEVWET